MSSKIINTHPSDTVNSVDPILNLKDNPNKGKKLKQENDTSNQSDESRYQKICSKLKQTEYELIFEDKFIEDFIQNDLNFFEKNRKKRKEEIALEKNYLEKEKEYSETKEDLIETDIVDKKKEQMGNINQKGKERLKEETKINNKFNLIKIYIDLKNLYEENVKENLISEDFRIFLNKILGYKDKNDLIEKFDILCQRIKGNLFGKMGSFFSIVFFKNIKPKMLKFINRFHMIRLFIAMKENNKKIRNVSIINRKNIISSEILYNVIIKMIGIYKTFNPMKKRTQVLVNFLNQGFDIINTSSEQNKKINADIFIKDELEYIDILRDYIFFLKNFIYNEQNIQNDNVTIYDKYISFYDVLSIFNNDNYSYINEYKCNKIYNDENAQWNKYIKEEYEDEGLYILYDLLESMSNKREEGIFFESKTEFYETIFILLKTKIEEKEKRQENNEEENNRENTEDIKLIYLIIKIILSDEDNIFKNYLKNEEEKKQEIFKPIILYIRKNLIDYIDKNENYNNNLELEYLNSLLILLQSFGEYKNRHLIEYIFEKYEEQFKSVFDVLIDAYEQILIDLGNNTEYNDAKKNKLIILDSLTNCITEYIDLSNNNKKKKTKKDKKKKKKETTIIDNKITKINQIINLKLLNLKIRQNAELNRNLKYDIFIIENHLQILIHLIKTFDIEELNTDHKLNYLLNKLQFDNSRTKHKQLFFDTLLLMNRCFKGFLILQKITLNYEKESYINNIEYDIKFEEKNLRNIGKYAMKDIKEDVSYLLDRYKKNNLNVFLNLEHNGEDELAKYHIKQELLVLIFLNYQKLFYLINSDSIELKKFEYFLYINDNDNNIRRVRNIINHFFDHGKKRLIVLLSFLQKIHDIIEMKIDNQFAYQLNLLNPEYLNLSRNSKDYFSSLIDYTSPETKLMTIYNYIECIVYNINRKKWEQNEPTMYYIYYPRKNWGFINKLAINTYKFWEVINLLLFLSINIVLIIKYKKSRNEEEIIFNEINNRQSFLVTDIWPIIHIVLLIVFIIYWCFSRFKLEYFFAMTKYINEYFSEEEKLEMGEKAKLLNKEKSEFFINDFFPETYERNINNYFDENNSFVKLYRTVVYYYVNYIKVFAYTLKMIYPFIFSIICLALSYWSQIFYILPVFLFFNFSETLTTILLLFTEQSSTLLLLFFSL